MLIFIRASHGNDLERAQSKAIEAFMINQTNYGEGDFTFFIFFCWWSEAEVKAKSVFDLIRNL